MALPVPLLCVRALSKEYRVGLPGQIATHFVLRNVDLDVYTNECVAIVGPPGSGKSTLLLCLAGLLHPTTGLIHWNLPPDASGCPARIVYVPERPAYYGFLTVSEVLGYYVSSPSAPIARPTVITRPSTSPARRDASDISSAERIERTLVRAGLQTKAHQNVGELSPADVQRLRLAQALVAAPRVILFDELSPELDDRAFTDVQRIINELAESGILVVLASRDEVSARQLAPKMIHFPSPWSPALPARRIAEARTLRENDGKDMRPS
jgi:ABC-type multidrug transport system ATPase subunit